MKLLFSNYLGITVTAFRGLSNYFALQLQFPCFCSKMQLHEIIPLGNFKNFLQLQLHDLMVFESKI